MTNFGKVSIILGISLLFIFLVFHTAIAQPVDNEVPSTPTNLLALVYAVYEYSQVELTWASSLDNVGVAGYKIYRCLAKTDSLCIPAQSDYLTSTTGTSYADPNIPIEILFKIGYSVSAFDAAGNESSLSSTSYVISVPPQQQSLFLLYPNGGEQWQANSVENIKWDWYWDRPVGEFTKFDISLLNAGTAIEVRWQWIGIRGQEGTNTFGISVPDFSPGNFVIEICNQEYQDVCDKSDQSFNIVAGTPPLPSQRGDLNNDDIVDVIDLGIFLSNWGKTTKPLSDINQDGRVDVIDLGILLSNWG